MRIAVVIPVYRDPSADELISIHRCFQVLSNYNILLVYPEGYNTLLYQKLCTDYGVEINRIKFNAKFFESIAGYNRLLLSEMFYSRFINYDYLLIYQPDAFVFEDRLWEWCEKGYDYIGAPIIGNCVDNDFHLEIMRVGNGGFSLRRVQAYLDYFSGKKNVIPINGIADRINLKSKLYTRWLVWLLMVFGWHNKPKSYATQWKYNEDDFWSCALVGTNYEMSKPTPREAMSFAFEKFPKELFEITKELPFGCHAWKKYQYDLFWKKYIK